MAAGSLAGVLPDRVDKPLGHVLLASSNNGWLVAHSLAFVFVLLVTGLLAARRRRAKVASLVAACVLSHQLLDAMWRASRHQVLPAPPGRSCRAPAPSTSSRA